MKNIIISILVIFVLFSVSIDLKGSEEQPGIIIYKHTDFQGTYKFIPIGQNITSLRTIKLNDKISSIKLIRHGQVIIYEHDNFLGGSTIIKTHIYDMATFFQGSKGNWNDRISSLKVISSMGNAPIIQQMNINNAFCIFYKDINKIDIAYSEIVLGDSNKMKQEWNGKINSIWIKEGYEIVIYQQEGFQGRQLLLKGRTSEGTYYNLNQFKFDKISSYKIAPIPGYRFRGEIQKK